MSRTGYDAKSDAKSFGFGMQSASPTFQDYIEWNPTSKSFQVRQKNGNKSEG